MSSAFIDILHRLTGVLGQFADPPSANSMIWDGKAYSPAPSRKFDPSAAKWWATLTAIAAMLGKQGAPLSLDQKVYLDRLLFGGMGSLNDFALDERSGGGEAMQANQELERLRKELFEQFQRVDG